MSSVGTLHQRIQDRVVLAVQLADGYPGLSNETVALMAADLAFAAITDADIQQEAVLAERERVTRIIREQIEALVDYESADLPPGGTWISRAKVLALVERVRRGGVAG